MPFVPIRFFPLVALLIALTACGASTDGNTPTGTGSASASPASLFSEQLHALPMPGPGRARIEFKGQVIEAALFSDCSVVDLSDLEDWEPHAFTAWITVPMADGEADLKLHRLVHPKPENWATAAHEHELLLLTMPNRTDLYSANLVRLKPGDGVMIARPMDKPARPAGPEDSLPGIRVHPDGHQATFLGLLGQGSMIEDVPDPDWQEIAISIHCGPV